MAENPKDERQRALWAAIRQKVCAVCLDQHDDGTCGLTDRACAIDRHLPVVARAVGAVDSGRMEEYFAAIEAQVCAPCPQQDAQGHCALRGKGDCALHTYLFLVVDAIETASAPDRAS